MDPEDPTKKEDEETDSNLLEDLTGDEVKLDTSTTISPAAGM